MDTWRLEQTVIHDNSETHQQSSYREDRCAICMNLIRFDQHLDRWVHGDLTVLCHERAA